MASTEALSEQASFASDEPETIETAVIALVCSAGGLDALTTVLGGLPIGLRAAVIVLQHQRPDRPSHLARILGRRCSLPLALVTNGEVLRAGRVRVIPPGSHALVTSENRISLIRSDGPPPYRPSGDLLLTSLALVAAKRSIAVILSGEGNDGATGATALHDFGGTVVASDELSSEHYAMPEAAIGRDDVVDYVLPLKAIADALVELVGVTLNLAPK
jgi:two-component system chemotaxis response regulator CheB